MLNIVKDKAHQNPVFIFVPGLFVNAKAPF
jgi:hypothetical protein